MKGTKEPTTRERPEEAKVKEKSRMEGDKASALSFLEEGEQPREGRKKPAHARKPSRLFFWYLGPKQYTGELKTS